MGEKSSRPDRRRVILCILVVSMFLMCGPQIFFSNSAGSDASGNSSKSGDLQSSFVPYDPVSQSRPVNESAVGFDRAGGSGRTVILPGGPNTLSVTLDSQWVGTKIYTSVLNLWDLKGWLINGTFDTGRNTAHSTNYSAPWFSDRAYDSHRSTTTANASADRANWVSSGKYVNVSLPWWPAYYQPSVGIARNYTYGEYAAFNETFTVPRGTVLAANLSLAYHPNYDTVLFSLDSFEVYVSINGHIVWTRGQAQMKSSEANKWNVRSGATSITVPTNVFNAPAQQSMTISVGVMYDSASQYFGGATFNTQNGCWFDNVSLSLKSLVKPEQVKLKLAAPGSPNTNCNITSPSPSAYGNGSGTLTGFTIGPGTQATYNFNFLSNVSAPVRCSFAANATIYVKKQRTADSTAFANQGSNINWSVSVVTWPQRYGQSVSTTNYTKYYFNVSVPSDWSLATCKYPNGTMQSISNGLRFYNWTIGSIRILRVNVTYINSYSPVPNVGPPYVIYALSSNYVKQVWTQLQTGPSTYVNETKFYPQNYTKFVAYIAGAGPVSNGIANLTVRGPATYGASPSVIYTKTGVKPVSGFANFTVLWNTTHAAGNYSAQVDWVNNTLGEAGSLTCEFNITRIIRLTISIPAVGDVLIVNTYLINPPTTVVVQDYYTNQSITANVTGHLSWESAGRCDNFTTYVPAQSAYTNQTHVPAGLPVPSDQWLSVNATKLFYDKATANNTFSIGDGAYLDHYTQAIAIEYTEPTFKLNLTQIYYAGNSSGKITDATFDILAQGSSNNSIVQWDNPFRFEKDLSQQSNGYYSGKINVGTISGTVKAIPASGNSYTVYFRFAKAGVQTRYFTFTLTVSDAHNYLTVKSGNGQYVWWGQNATIKLNYTTYWQTGSFPNYIILTKKPIQNTTASPCYAPPFVSASYTWGGSSWVYHKDTDQAGIYTLDLNTAWFSPTADNGSSASLDVRFTKPNYVTYPLDDSNLVHLTVYIMRLTTSITGAVNQTNGVLLSTNATSVYPGDPKTIFVWYNDTHLGGSVGFAGSSLSYTSTGDKLSHGSLTPVSGIPGLYSLALNGTLTYQRPGTYALSISASNLPHYVSHSVTITLTMLAIPSFLQATSTPSSFYYLDRITYLLWFNDTHNGVPITVANFTVDVPHGIQVLVPQAVPGFPGLYNITVVLPVSIGDYKVNVTASNVYYDDGVQRLQIHVSRLPTALVSYVLSSDGSILVQNNATVDIGGSLTIYLWFNDTHNGMSIPGAEDHITYRSTNSKWGPGLVSPVSGVPGLYKVTLQISDAGAFDITFNATFANYDPQTLTFTVNVPAPPPGFSFATLMLVGFGGGGIVVVGVVSWLLMRRARIPFIIKKIDETLKLINKGDHEGAVAVALRTREESIVGITQDRIEAFSKRKAVAPGAAEAVPLGKAAEEAAVVAPAAEVEGALKKELKAVEPGKPEEEIEEVEMETLDEELGRLEKVDTGQEVPEGAKQARDVIDEYKKRKKKR